MKPASHTSARHSDPCSLSQMPVAIASEVYHCGGHSRLSVLNPDGIGVDTGSDHHARDIMCSPDGKILAVVLCGEHAMELYRGGRWSPQTSANCDGYTRCRCGVGGEMSVRGPGRACIASTCCQSTSA
jgi:hypothetical protein